MDGPDHLDSVSNPPSSERADRRGNDDPSLFGPTVTLAIAELVNGELDRSAARCRQVLDRSAGDPGAATDGRAARAVLAVIAHLCGDHVLARRLGVSAVASRNPTAAPVRADVDRAVASIAVPALVLAHEATGDHDLGRSMLGVHPLATAHRSALDQLVGPGAAGPRSGAEVEANHRVTGPSDLEIGTAAAALLSRDRWERSIGHDPAAIGAEGPEAIPAVWIDTLAAAGAAGHRLSLSVPVSVERAHAVGLALRGERERAAAVLDTAEDRWRRQRAYTELAEVLVLRAEIALALGHRGEAEERASEGYGLANRLGHHAVGARALALHHPSPDGLDLGSADERSVLVSDVAGSTKVSTTAGDEAYVDLIMTHHDTVRPLLERHGGVEFSEGGDSLLAWFESPEDTLDCALAILDAVAVHRRAGCDLHVRLAIAGGRPYFRNGRPYGRAVNLANRLLPTCARGQIVVDEATLARLGPIVDGFASRMIRLDDFGTTAIGFLTPVDAA